MLLGIGGSGGSPVVSFACGFGLGNSAASASSAVLRRLMGTFMLIYLAGRAELAHCTRFCIERSRGILRDWKAVARTMVRRDWAEPRRVTLGSCTAR
jgi:hypothetical protein